MSDVQGFLAQLTLDTQDMTVYLNDVSMTQSKNAMSKATMDGTGAPTQLAGQVTGTLSMSGQIDTAGSGIISTIFAKADPVAFVLQMGDAGSYAGSVLLSEYDIDASASDSINFTLSGDTSGPVPFTAPV